MTLGKVPSVLWTIPVELTFYVFLPVCLRHFLRLTRSSLGAGALTALFAAWCVCIAIARHHGVPAEFWMTLGFHHYANTFVGGVLLYALLANGHIAFPRAGAAIAYGAPALFLLAYPFVSCTLFAGDFRMTELSDRAAWQAYYDLIFPFAPFLVGGIVYGLLHPSREPSVDGHAREVSAPERRHQFRRLSHPYSDDRSLRFALRLWRPAVPCGGRLDPCGRLSALGDGGKAGDRFGARNRAATAGIAGQRCARRR